MDAQLVVWFRAKLSLYHYKGPNGIIQNCTSKVVESRHFHILLEFTHFTEKCSIYYYFENMNLYFE